MLAESYARQEGREKGWQEGRDEGREEAAKLLIEDAVQNQRDLDGLRWFAYEPQGDF